MTLADTLQIALVWLAERWMDLATLLIAAGTFTILLRDRLTAPWLPTVLDFNVSPSRTVAGAFDGRITFRRPEHGNVTIGAIWASGWEFGDEEMSGPAYDPEPSGRVRWCHRLTPAFEAGPPSGGTGTHASLYFVMRPLRSRQSLTASDRLSIRARISFRRERVLTRTITVTSNRMA